LGRGGAQEDHLFLSERYRPLTPNAITLLCGRLKKRAGMTEKRVSPSVLRETFAVRYLLDGGEPTPLQELLGLEDKAAVTRYLRLSQQVRQDQKRKQRPADHHW
jgi:site-specific recombinase XerD